MLAVIPRLLGENERRPHLAALIWIMEIRLRHADHRETFSVKRQCLAHDPRVPGEPLEPESVTEHDNPFPARFALFRQESSSVGRLHAERVKETRRHTIPAEALGLIAVRQIERM